MPMMWYGYGWGAFLLMLLSMFLWFAVLGLLVWALVRWLAVRAPGSGFPTAGPTALEILRQRYARGEIDTATVQQMRDELEGTSARSREPLTAS